MPHGARPLRSTRRLQNVQASLARWYNIAPATTAAAPTKISIYDEIGMFGCPAAMFLDELNQVSGDIELHLHSPGGDIYEGLAIYNGLLQARQRGDVSIIIDGLAASAASFIAMAASPGKLEVSPHSRMMIHDGFCMAIGNAKDMRELADQLDEESDNIAGIYADRTGKPKDYWRGKMRAETWYGDQQAVDEGLADRIHGQDPAPADQWDMSVFANYATGLANGTVDHWNRPRGDAPPAAEIRETARIHAAILNAASAAGEGSGDAKPEPEQLGDGWVKDPDGSVRFDPDGDGDDDSTPEGDTDHDYFDEDGKQVKPIPPKPGSGKGGASDRAALPIRAAAPDIDNSPWDASKAWHNGAESDDPAAFYKGICAGRKSGDPSTQDAWALPYKYHPGDAPNAAGVRAALARLGSTQGLTNKDEAQALLERLMKQVNPDYKPDDLADAGLLAAALFSLERG